MRAWFDFPEALILLALAVPWIAWGRQAEPRDWPVGGLEPFREALGVAPARRRWPPSLWLGLLALVCGALAAAGARLGGGADLVVEDRSFSCFGGDLGMKAEVRVRAWFHEAVAPLLRGADLVTVGSPAEPAAEEEIFAALRLHGLRRRTAVVTDRPAPTGLPAGVRWLNPPLPAHRDRNAALLHAWPEDPGWRVRWARWGDVGPIALWRNGGPAEELEGEEGIAALPGAVAGDRLEVRRRDGSAADEWPQDDALLLGGPRIRVPPPAAAAWELAVRAVWPGAEVVRSGPADFEVRLGVVPAPGAEDSPWDFQADPFGTLPELEAVAELHRRLEPLQLRYGGHRRPRSECEPPGPPRPWPADLRAPRAPPASSLPMALLGLALYLGSLALRHHGR